MNSQPGDKAFGLKISVSRNTTHKRRSWTSHEPKAQQSVLYDPEKLIERFRALGLGFWWKSTLVVRQPGIGIESSDEWHSGDVAEDKLFEALDLLT